MLDRETPNSTKDRPKGTETSSLLQNPMQPPGEKHSRGVLLIITHNENPKEQLPKTSTLQSHRSEFSERRIINIGRRGKNKAYLEIA